jgi:hypothetical protein
MAACRQITGQLHNATPNEAECARQATEKAMAQVHQVEAGAAKGK